MWCEDESFWQDFYDVLFPPDSFQMAESNVGKMLDLIGVQSGTALDLCCGPGRYALPLARKGFRVTGVDRSAFLLRIAERRVSEAGMQGEFVSDDMRVFRRPSSFDVAFSLGNSLGYFDSREEDRAVIERIHDNLLPGGWLVIEMTCKEWLARSARDFVSDHADGAMCVRRHTTSDCWTKQVNRWTLIRGDVVRRFEYTLHIYSGIDIRELLLDAGFANVRLYGDFDGRPFEGTVNRLVATAQKAG